MKSTRSRFIWVAILVFLFATGMATFLNYYKYKSTFAQIVKSRLLVIGYGIENSVQTSLGLGMGFSELGALPDLMEREKAADKLITGIDVFDSAGKMLYSTDPARVGKAAPERWVANATGIGAKGKEWQAEDEREFVAGISLKNNFDLTVGYLALRYTRDHVDANVEKMGWRLLLIGAVTFACASAFAALILMLILRRYERDMQAIGERIAGGGEAQAVPEAFRPPVEELRDAIAGADASIAGVRRKLQGA